MDARLNANEPFDRTARIVVSAILIGIAALLTLLFGESAVPETLGDELSETQEVLLRFLENDIVKGQLAAFVALLFYVVIVVWQSASDCRHLLAKAPDRAAAERFASVEETRQHFISYVVWALPITGFIGTVIGISDAIGPLASIGDPAAQATSMPAVLEALRYAFDTTLSGLLLVIPAMALNLYRQSLVHRLTTNLMESASPLEHHHAAPRETKA